ncbi:hypothetical protein F5H01DRAFT_163233 [Linnemannia elongata]|nr:hypothetical protein F5H01DRAFT_163233 [Linnemannia elongata]
MRGQEAIFSMLVGFVLSIAYFFNDYSSHFAVRFHIVLSLCFLPPLLIYQPERPGLKVSIGTSFIHAAKGPHMLPYL